MFGSNVQAGRNYILLATLNSCTRENFARFQGSSTVEAVSDVNTGKVGACVSRRGTQS